MSKTYEEFLESKKRKFVPVGFEVNREGLNPKLYDFQRACVEFFLRKGRAAAFEDCGLGKTAQQLCWADEVCRKTGGEVLILAPLAVSRQTRGEGLKFGYNVNICRGQEDVKRGINITNYEMLEKFEPCSFAGVVLDESSILKSYMGATKRRIISAFKDVPYKLAATATPSPNDHMEILNQAEFLGIMRSSEALAIWFINDSSHSGKYRLKAHAVKDFWQWVSSWAVCIEKPSDIGFNDEGFILPGLSEQDIIIPVDLSDSEKLVRDIDMSATGFHKEKRRTAEDRAKKCAEIVSSTKEQYVVWCQTDYEADYLKKYIPEAVEVRGSQKAEYKERAAIGFIEGQFRVLISKPKIFGYGLNFQNCRNCVFCGLDYSYENYYQAVRRFWRFGQKKDVNVFRVLGETENHILEVVNLKQNLHDEMHSNMYEVSRKVQREAFYNAGHRFKLNTTYGNIKLPVWLTERTGNAVCV